MTPNPTPFVSIVMPALNEERFIEAAIQSVLPKDAPFDWELLVLDGGSTDRTREIVNALARGEPRIRLIPNPKRIQAAAMNLAAAMADPRAATLVRADAHALYPDGFVARCVATLRRTSAASVVVPLRTRGRGLKQRAIAVAQNSRLGNGGAAHRTGLVSGFVDHGHHAAFDRRAYLACGGYDERFRHNEDAEFDIRLGKAGGRIYLDATLPVCYFPRESFSALSRQYWNYGTGRASTLLKHRIRPKLRQMLPAAAFAGFAASLPLALVEPHVLLLPAVYAAPVLVWGGALAAKRRDRAAVLSGFAAIVMHMSWGAGFLRRLAAAALSTVALRRDRRKSGIHRPAEARQ